MRVLITGGAGFIGSHLAEHFSVSGAEVRVLDNLRTGYLRNLDGLTCDFRRGSVTEAAELAAAMDGVELVFHLAAMVSVPESVEHPDECVRINTLGTLNVLAAAKKAGVRKVVLASSAAVYGDNPQVPKREDMLPEPKSPYAVTKLDGEYYLRMYRDAWALDTVSLRFFNVFGPRQDPSSHYAAAVPIFIHRALRHQDIVIFGDGAQVRDFVYVKDLVRAILMGVERGRDVYNVGRGEYITILELARRIVQITGSRSKIVFAAERPGDIRASYADISRLCALGYNPSADLETGLAATIQYFSALME
ncbi:NAD-dependent epimerase/dehydratase family protein [bacterium]|nr:NAD-dependent epimerase/dehydratase family protein [bacterium]